MEKRSGLEQGRTQVAEGSKLKLHQENREGGENSKALAGVGSPPSIAMRGELQGGSLDSGASPFHMKYSEIPPRPPPQAPVQGPDGAAFNISKAAEVAVPAIGSVKSKQTQSPGDCVDDRNLLTPPKAKSSAEGRINDSHDPDEFSKKLDLVVPAPAHTGSHSSHEDEHGSGSRSQLQMRRAKRRSHPSIPWIGPPCSRCKSTNFSMYTDANAKSVVKLMHYQCNNCKQHLCTRENVRSYKHSGSRFKVENRAKKGASQLTRRGIGVHRIIQAMSNLKPSTLAASNSNMKTLPPPSTPNLKAMPPPSNPNLKAMRPPSDPNMKLMPPPSYTRKPIVCLPDNQDTAFHSAQTTFPPRSSSFSDKLKDGHPSRESNLQLVVAREPEERFPMEIVEAKGPFHLSAGHKEPPSNQSAKGNQKEPSFAIDGFSGKGLRDSIRGHRSSPLEENKKGSDVGTVSDGGHPSNGLPCPSCKSTNTRFFWLGRYYCDNCQEFWTLGHLQQHEVQLPSKQSPKGKGKEKEKETPYEDADQFSGKGLGDSSRGARSLPWSGSEDGDGGSNEGPLIALNCSRCKSTFTRLCTYGVFCDACGKHTPFAGTRDREVPADPPVAMVHEVFDADGRSRGSQMQSLPPPRRPIMVPRRTRWQWFLWTVASGSILCMAFHTHSHQVDEHKRRRGN